MYQAFEPSIVLDKLPVKVESLAYYRQNLYIGTLSGALLLYKIINLKEGEDGMIYVDEFGEKMGIELVKSYKSFSKKPVERMEVIPELGLLLALTDNQVNAYDLFSLQYQSGLAPNYLASQAKGSLSFDSFTGLETLESGVPSMTTRVCIKGKKHLIMLMWIDSEFSNSHTKEYPIPDKVISMEFISATVVFLITSSKGYYRLDLTSGEIIPLILGVSSNHGSRSESPNPGNLDKEGSMTSGVASMISGLAYTSTQYVSSYNPLGPMFSYIQPIPPMLRLSDNEMILVRDNVGYFVDSEGTITRQITIHFQLPPLHLIHSFPYLLITYATMVEVRNLDTQAIVQSIPTTTSPTSALRDKAPFIGYPNSIMRYVPSHFADQINKLIEIKLFTEALTLLDQNKHRVTEVKVKGKEEIQLLLGKDLFYLGQYEKAFEKFMELNLDPIDVILLYPPILSENESVFELSKSNDGNLPYHYTEDSKEWPYQRSLHAINQLIQYLTQCRNFTLTQLNSDTNNSKLNSKMTLIDTTLIKSYYITNPNMIGPLLRLKNFVDIDIIEPLFQQSNRNNDLIELYYSKSLHRKGLKLLKELGQSNENELNGVIPTINYLKRLGNNHFDLIQQYLPWCLEWDENNSMTLFLTTHPTSDTFDSPTIANFLCNIYPDLALIYLNKILPKQYRYFKNENEIDDNELEHHNKEQLELFGLVPNLLIDSLTKILIKLNDNNNNSTNELDIAIPLEKWCINIIDKSNLNEFINDIENIDLLLNQFKNEYFHLLKYLQAEPFKFKPEKVLSRLTTKGLFKPRALVLSKLNRHSQALSLLVDKLNDINGAEQYCLTNQGSEPYECLLKVYLNEQPNDDSNLKLDLALKLLDRYASHLPIPTALSHLPTSTQVLNINAYLTRNLRAITNNQLTNQLTLALLRANNQRLSINLVKSKDGPIIIDDHTLCPKCLKKVGKSAFVVDQQRKVVHYSCFV